MEKVLNKWYFGVIIIPILVNYLTDFIGLPDLFSNWTYTIIGILAIIILILSIELIRVNNKNTILRNQPRQSDKLIVNELLETLDIDNFQAEIKEQNGWYGYKKTAISGLISL